MQTTSYQYVSTALIATFPFRGEEKACLCDSFFSDGGVARFTLDGTDCLARKVAALTACALLDSCLWDTLLM